MQAMLLGERGDFFVGEWPYHMYVEYQQPAPSVPGHSLPVAFFHGGCGTGASYWSTPDGRKSWAPYFAEVGWTVYVVDWPGHGRSGFPPDYATMPYERVVEAGIALVEKIGPAILLVGSMSGPVGWKMAEAVPERIRAILAWAPGPPTNLMPVNALRPGETTFRSVDESQPWRYFDREYFHKRFSGGPLFPHEHFEQNFMREVPESARIMNQRYNKDGMGLYLEDPDRVRSVPILIITADHDSGHTREHDAKIAAYLGADQIYLPDVGMPGHGHQMRFDHGNLEIADLMFRWLKDRGIE